MRKQDTRSDTVLRSSVGSFDKFCFCNGLGDADRVRVEGGEITYRYIVPINVITITPISLLNGSTSITHRDTCAFPRLSLFCFRITGVLYSAYVHIYLISFNVRQP
jgi:hypothetical protein